MLHTQTGTKAGSEKLPIATWDITLDYGRFLPSTSYFSIACMRKKILLPVFFPFFTLESKLSNHNKTLKDWQFTDNLINLEEK
jgi:hypothetical protein